MSNENETAEMTADDAPAVFLHQAPETAPTDAAPGAAAPGAAAPAAPEADEAPETIMTLQDFCRHMSHTARGHLPELVNGFFAMTKQEGKLLAGTWAEMKTAFENFAGAEVPPSKS